MRTAFRYTLFQIPGWLLAAAVLGFVWEHGLLAGAWAGVLLALWVAKDAALYPVLRRSYEPGRAPHGTLLDARAVARETLAPVGYVELQGQLWRAVVRDGGVVSHGGTVRVVAVDGLTLSVVPDDDVTRPRAVRP